MAIYSPSIELAEKPTLHNEEVTRAATDMFGDGSQWEPLSGGSNPDVFAIDGKLGRGVMKFFPKDSRQAEYEVASMERAQEAGVPVPKVLGRGVLETVAGQRPWFAMEHIDGRPMSEVKLTAGEETTVADAVGRYLGRLHAPSQPTPDGFWRQVGIDGNRPVWHFKSWYDYLGHIGETLESNTDHLQTAGLTSNEIDAILSNVAEYRTMPPDRPIFSHADLRKAHVYLNSNNDVTSIIDWGSGQANGPEREFSKPFGDNDEPMIAAYASASGQPKDELKERIRRMQTAHLPGLAVFNVKKGRMSDAYDRVHEVRRLLK